MKKMIILVIAVLAIMLAGCAEQDTEMSALNPNVETSNPSVATQEEFEEDEVSVPRDTTFDGMSDEEILEHNERAYAYAREAAEQNRRMEEEHQAAMSEKEQWAPRTTPRATPDEFYDEFEGLSDTQIEQIKELREKTTFMPFTPYVGDYSRPEAVIRGEIPADAPRLDLKTVKAILFEIDLKFVDNIISERNIFENIIVEFNKIHKYYDRLVGINLPVFEYWLDNEGSEKILVRPNGVVYYHSPLHDGRSAPHEYLFTPFSPFSD